MSLLANSSRHFLSGLSRTVARSLLDCCVARLGTGLGADPYGPYVCMYNIHMHTHIAHVYIVPDGA